MIPTAADLVVVIRDPYRVMAFCDSLGITEDMRKHVAEDTSGYLLASYDAENLWVLVFMNLRRAGCSLYLLPKTLCREQVEAFAEAQVHLLTCYPHEPKLN